MLDGKTVVVTGGTGSFGRVLVRRLLAGDLGEVSKVVVFSRDEAKQQEMRLAYLERRTSTDEVIYENSRRTLAFQIGDVRDYGDVCRALHAADVVINAAALKQVPTCEYVPDQAVLTNCLGAMNIVRAVEEHDYGVETVIGISTDKACKPVNAMGMTKALQERILVAGNVKNPQTRFVLARYGNVLASRGSVIPLFLDQIRQGGPVTVTDRRMTRFLVSFDRAVDVVAALVREGRPGETYVPICPSATIVDLARALIGDRRIDIVDCGVRPGEKIHETLVSEEEIRRTLRRGEHLVVRPMLPELASGTNDEPALTEEYTSAQSPIDLDAVVGLLRQHALLQGEGDPEDALRW